MQQPKTTETYNHFAGTLILAKPFGKGFEHVHVAGYQVGLFISQVPVCS